MENILLELRVYGFICILPHEWNNKNSKEWEEELEEVERTRKEIRINVSHEQSTLDMWKSTRYSIGNVCDDVKICFC